MKVPLAALTRIRDVLVQNEQALRVLFVELHQPGACEKWTKAMEARVDFDHFVINPAVGHIDLELEVAP